MAPTHQIWKHFIDPQTLEVYQLKAVCVYLYPPIIHQSPRTRPKPHNKIATMPVVRQGMRHPYTRQAICSQHTSYHNS